MSQYVRGFVPPVARRAGRGPDHTSPPPVPDAAAQLREERQRHVAFVATLAHEMRQSLSALSNAAEILVHAPDTVAPAAVAIIQRQTQHMNRLLDDVIESALWARGTTLLRRERVDVRDVIAATHADVSGVVAARGHSLMVSAGPEALWVDADPGRLKQVLLNLFDNAIKFTERGGTIRLIARRAGSDITISVSDTGRGLHPDERAHIFELFSQGRPGEGRGLGIGLSVAAGILALHGGGIEARSAGPAHGTEFVVTLPMAGTTVASRVVAVTPVDRVAASA